jgi:hypothetical protein
MDRLVTIAWRAFWVGLGASAVLVAQMLASAPRETPAAPAVQDAAPASALPMQGQS